MKDFKEEAKDLGTKIVVLQCNVICPELTPIGKAFTKLAFKKGGGITTSDVKSILDFKPHLNNSATLDITNKILSFCDDYRAELEDLVNKLESKQQSCSRR